ADNSLPEYDSFCFEIEPDQERLINLMKNDISDYSSRDPLLEEADLFLASDNSIPPSIEDVADDSEGDICFLEELLINDSILSHESSNSNFEDNPSILRPPSEPPNAETDTREKIPVVMNDKDKFDEDYYFFMIDKVFYFLSVESEDTIFDPAFPCRASEDKRDYDVPVFTIDVCDNHSEIFSDSKIDDDILVYDNDFEDTEYVEASLSDPEIVNVEEENVVQQEEEEFDLEDISHIQVVLLREKLLSIIRLISNIESLNDNSTPDRVLNSFKSDNSLSDNFSPEFKTFCDYTKETRSGNTTTHAHDSLPEYDSFCFEIKPDQERLINVLKNDISDDSSNDPLLEEVNLFLASDNLIPSGIKNFGDDSEGDIRFLEELLIDDSIPFPINEESDFNDPSVPRPPPEPPDAELNSREENTIDELECLDPRDEIDIRIFLQCLICSKLFLLFLSTESEDTIFDPGESDSEEIENFLNDNSIPIGVENFVFDQEEDILFLEELLNEDPPPMNPNQAKSFIEEPEHSFSMGYEHFNTTLVTELDKVAESSIKNLVSIPHECEVTSDNEIESNEPVKDDSLVFTNSLFNDSNDFTSNDNESIHDVPIEESKVHSNPLFDNNEINSDELESHIKSNFVESLSNHDALIDSTQSFDHLDEFSGPLIPIHIAEEERIRREHAEYISHMDMLFTINPRPRPTANANTIVESFPPSLIPVQDNDSQREEIEIVTNTNELLPPGFENDDSEEEVGVVDDLRVDNSISNSKNKLSDNEVSYFDNPSVPRPPPEPPDANFNFETDLGEEISVVMNDSDKLECLDPRDEFDNDDYFSFMFLIYAKVFSFLLSAESEDTIFDHGISV
nr:hypothetical protein [Tanacetum cinerariifolium]